MENSSTNVDESLSGTESDMLKKYYKEHDIFLSAEGILKISSVILCTISSVLLLRSASCAGAPSLVQSSAIVVLFCGGVMALFFIGELVRLPLYVPQLWLFTDIIISTVMAVLLLVTAVLSMTVCEPATPIDYVNGPLAVINAGVVTSSTVIRYLSVIKLWDVSRAPPELCEGPPGEVDV